MHHKSANETSIDTILFVQYKGIRLCSNTVMHRLMIWSEVVGESHITGLPATSRLVVTGEKRKRLARR